MENFTPYRIAETTRQLDTAANLPTAQAVAQRYANDLGHEVYILGPGLNHPVMIEPEVDTAR